MAGHDAHSPIEVGPPDGAGRRFERHAFVCTNPSSCALDGAEAVQAALKGMLQQAGAKERLRINKAGCLGQCGHGPMMVVYPEGVWYSHLSVADAERVWSEHLLGGKPVEELRYRTPEGGTNVLARGPDNAKRPLGGPRSEPCDRC